jgi:peptide/nickel transport system permease protein
VVGATLAGGAWAPNEPTARLGAPWAPPGDGLLLGADVAGRDVASRVLAGGADLVVLALVAATLSTVLGTSAGLAAGWRPSVADRFLSRLADVALAVPFLLVALVLAASLPGWTAVVVGTAAGGAPLTLRLVRDATRQVGASGYVEAARCRGERPAVILAREVLPAVGGLVAAEAAMRAVVALQLAAALGLLGFGPAPPAPDWGAMLRENLPGMTLNPAAVAAPAVALTAVSLPVALAARAWSRA